MSEIIKTEAFVLGKINYGDTSSITALFTKDFGRLSAIVKGGRNPKSKIAHVIDPLNHVNVVIYKKDNRELQLLTTADLLDHYPNIKNNLEKLQYSYSVLELIKTMLPENEVNLKLFKASERIFKLIDTTADQEKLLFAKFFLYFISQLGYAIQFDRCSNCGKTIGEQEYLSYNYQIGILCNDCRNLYSWNYLEAELFNCLKSLKVNQQMVFSPKTYAAAINFLEQYLKIHIPDFKGLQSLKIFN